MSNRFIISNFTASALLSVGLLSVPTLTLADIELANAGIKDGMSVIESVLVDGAPDAFREVLANGGPQTAEAMGHVFFMRRHFDAAGWMFGAQALAGFDQAAALSNYAAMAVELHADNSTIFDNDFLGSGLEAARAAVEMVPDNGAFQNNLSRAALDTSVATEDSGLIEESLNAARQANILDPDTILYMTNLARVLSAAGEYMQAAEIMSAVHALNPTDLSYLSASNSMRANSGYGDASASVARPHCDVNYRCQEICPKSIIGGLMSVTCEMENASAQMACAAGQPYAPTYNCNEDLPEYGILIPGLNSGFSIAVPGFSVHVIVQGDGSVDVRGEVGISAGPISGYVRGDGHYSPSNGFSSDNYGAGVRANLLNGSAAGDLASGFGHPPAHIEAEILDGNPPVVGIEAFNVPVITN